MAYFTFTQRGAFSNMFGALYHVCRQIDPNNGSPMGTIVTEPKKYEVILTLNTNWTGLYLRVLSYNVAELNRIEKYATTSYNFGSVEFYHRGYYIGSNFIKKPISVVSPDVSDWGFNNLDNTLYPAPLALSMVASNGFLPSIKLLEIQPADPNQPIIDRCGLTWLLFYIIPAPNVVLEIMYP